MDDKLTIFIAVTAGAVVLQMLILAGMYFTLRKLALQMHATTEEVKTKALPLLENGKNIQAHVQRFVETATPKLDVVLNNATSISTKVNDGVVRAESTLNDVLDRARLQVIRADDMVSRAMDSVEETTEKVTHSVTSPIKHASGIMHGISTGVGTFLGQKKARKPGPSDEMFI
jgi:hypothetical protein